MSRVSRCLTIAMRAAPTRFPAVVRVAATLVLVVTAACGQAATPGSSRTDTSSLSSCEETFRHWVRQSASLNSPGVDLMGVLIDGEGVQRRIFELCTLDQAERFNREILEVAPGVSRPMIEVDFRTFAEIECVDESPLLDGTPLCAEVQR